MSWSWAKEEALRRCTARGVAYDEALTALSDAREEEVAEVAERLAEAGSNLLRGRR